MATFLLAPFGAFGINLAAITAAIVLGPEAHADPRRRYYSITAAGRAALEADAARYDRLSRLARQRGVLPGHAQ